MMKIITYYRLSVVTAILFLLLAATWMFAPTQLLSGWGLELTTSVGLLGRRAAAFYLGIAVMLFMSRKAEPSIARTAIIYGMITACLLLAFLGVYEFSMQNANIDILIAVVIELVLVIAFMCVKCERPVNR